MSVLILPILCPVGQCAIVQLIWGVMCLKYNQQLFKSQLPQLCIT